MQADNLRPEDCDKLKEVFEKEIKPQNPDAVLQTFLRDKFKKKDCLFKDKCKQETLKPMTVRKLIKKYTKLTQEGYETIFLTQVLSDLRMITWKADIRRAERAEKSGNKSQEL